MREQKPRRFDWVVSRAFCNNDRKSGLHECSEFARLRHEVSVVRNEAGVLGVNYFFALTTNIVPDWLI